MTARTYADWISWGAEQLRASELDAPRLEARRLMEVATGLTASDIILREPDVLEDPQAIERFQAFIVRRTAREPLAHIAGVQAFFGLEFLSDARALVPRADSECVVEAALEKIPKDARWQIADLGTGTGCLLISILRHRENCWGIGVELDPDAATLAEANIDHHNLSQRACIWRGGWDDWTGWPDTDLIISNPPYIETKIIAGLEADVRQYDPHLALDGGADGLSAYRSIISTATTEMKSGAWLVFEIGYDQADPVRQLLSDAYFEAIEIGQDLGARNRVVCARKP